jgi:hypothetical protein
LYPLSVLLGWDDWSFGHAERPVFQRTQRFENWICFRPQVKWWKTPTLLDLSERANLNHWTTYVSVPVKLLLVFARSRSWFRESRVPWPHFFCPPTISRDIPDNLSRSIGRVNCWWPLPVQSSLVQSAVGLITILHCLTTLTVVQLTLWKTVLQSELLNDWRYTTNQFVLVPHLQAHDFSFFCGWTLTTENLCQYTYIYICI